MPASAEAVTPAATRTGRLPNGELRRQVAVHLDEAPGVAFTAGEIARALSRSSGAVANALTALASHGEAELVSERPARYRATPGTGRLASVPPAPTRPAPSRPSTPAPSTPGPTAAPSGTSAVPTDAITTETVTTPHEGPVTGPVARPNGQLYHPRTVAGMPDVTALRRLRAAGVPALLYGPPGTGKTSVVEAAFGDLITVPGDGDTTVADLVGEYTQTPEGRYVFVHGPLIRAMREGRALFVDDATLIPPNVLATLYPALDGRRQMIVKANGGEVVDATDGFYVVAGHNPGVHGAVLSDALASPRRSRCPRTTTSP